MYTNRHNCTLLRLPVSPSSSESLLGLLHEYEQGVTDDVAYLQNIPES